MVQAVKERRNDKEEEGGGVAERMLVYCVCVGVGEGGFRLAALPTDIYWTTSHTQSAST